MKIEYPHTIENTIGEKLVFKRVAMEDGEEKVIVENFVQPGCGPVMHTHWKQDESLTVMRGRMGYQILGEEERFAGPGETVVFERGTPTASGTWARKNSTASAGSSRPTDRLLPFGSLRRPE